MEQIILEIISKHVKKKEVIGIVRYMKGKRCLNNLITFYDVTTLLVSEGRAVDIVYLDISKAFNAVSHNILAEKLLKYRVDTCIVRWIKTS